MVISLPQNPLSAAKSLWRWAIISLPLDPLVLWLLIDSKFQNLDLNSLSTVAYFALGTGVLVAIFGSLPEIKTKASEIRRDLEQHARTLAIYGICFGVLLILFLIWQSGIEQLPQYGASVVVALGTLVSIYKSLTKAASTDRITMERQLFALSVIPIAAVRLGSLLFTLHISLLNPNQGGSCIAVWLLTLATLLAVEPAEDQFIATCKRCGSNTSRLDLSAGLCPNCHKRTT